MKTPARFLACACAFSFFAALSFHHQEVGVGREARRVRRAGRRVDHRAFRHQGDFFFALFVVVLRTVDFDFGFMRAETYLRVNKGVLVIVAYYIFLDDSRRSNYVNREFFYRRA